MKKIFVGNLAWAVSEDLLNSTFSKFGEIEDLRIILDRETGKSKGFGFITFKDKESVQKAIDQMDNTDLMGRNLRISEAKERRR